MFLRQTPCWNSVRVAKIYETIAIYTVSGGCEKGLLGKEMVSRGDQAEEEDGEDDVKNRQGNEYFFEAFAV